MITQKWKSRRVGFMLAGLVVVGLAVGLAIDLVQDYLHPARTRPTQVEKLEIALQGELELERSVQALKDCILRGDYAYSEDFVKHLDGIDRAVYMYRSHGVLGEEEQEALRQLYEALPKYQAAIHAVRRLRSADAPISEIDMAVKGQDRPISAAFRELEAASSVPNAFSGHLLRGVVVLFMCVALSGTLLFFSFAWPTSLTERSSGDDQSLQDLSSRILRWEEEKGEKAFSALHDKVCQSLSGVMYLLKGAEHLASRATDAALRSTLEPIIPSLQLALQDTLTVALELRPAGVQESSLLGTLEAIWVECLARKPSFGILARTHLEEEDIPDKLKQVILRIARVTLAWAGQETGTRQLVWDLAREQDRLHLSVQILRGREASRVVASSRADGSSPPYLPDVVRAHILLSGGTSDGVHDIAGGQAILATWPLAAEVSEIPCRSRGGT
jgi:hypothetical protein